MHVPAATWDRSSSSFLRRTLVVDAVTCVGTGLLLAQFSKPIGALFGLPVPLLFYAGLALLPIAAFIALTAMRDRAAPSAVWLVILGNAAWVAGSIVVLFMTRPTLLGALFVGVQAIAVAALAELEYAGLRRRPG